MSGAVRPYEYMHNVDMDGKLLSNWRLKEMKQKVDGRTFGFANRSDLQHALLEALGLKDEDGSIRENEPMLQCGVSVVGYQNHSCHVQVNLGDNTTRMASALLACDGIHSAVRRQMCSDSDIDDALHYCGQEVWWGKTEIVAGSALEKELQRMAKENDMEDGNVSISALGTRKKPGGFFSCEVAENVHAWVYVLKNKTPPSAGSSGNAAADLTRRGGVALVGTEKEKEIRKLVADAPSIVRSIMEDTSGDDVTRAGFFDRANQDVSYVDDRVALLGDAAHPQSPMMGQGANMAIVDGYVAATRIVAAVMEGGDGADGIGDYNRGESPIARALLAYDSKVRRKDNTAVIKKARKYGNWFASNGRFKCWAMRSTVKYASPSMLIRDMVSGDKSNRKFVAAMKEDLGQ